MGFFWMMMFIDKSYMGKNLFALFYIIWLRLKQLSLIHLLLSRFERWGLGDSLRDVKDRNSNAFIRLSLQYNGIVTSENSL